MRGPAESTTSTVTNPKEPPRKTPTARQADSIHHLAFVMLKPLLVTAVIKTSVGPAPRRDSKTRQTPGYRIKRAEITVTNLSSKILLCGTRGDKRSMPAPIKRGPTRVPTPGFAPKTQARANRPAADTQVATPTDTPALLEMAVFRTSKGATPRSALIRRDIASDIKNQPRKSADSSRGFKASCDL